MMMQKKDARNIYIIRGCALALAAAFIALGIFRGEAELVLKKAVRICLECIGVA